MHKHLTIAVYVGGKKNNINIKNIRNKHQLQHQKII